MNGQLGQGLGLLPPVRRDRHAPRAGVLDVAHGTGDLIHIHRVLLHRGTFPRIGADSKRELAATSGTRGEIARASRGTTLYIPVERMF